MLSDRTKLHVLDKVSLNILRGEVLGIAGESGSGKSTLLKAIYRFPDPSLIVNNGKIVLIRNETNNDEIILSLMSHEKLRREVWWKKISMIPQNAQNTFNPIMRIQDHFFEVYESAKGVEVKRDKYKVLEEIRMYIESLKLPVEILQAFPHQLSGGMKQRVVIALASIFKPSLILADEPTSALDVVNQKIALKMLKDIKENLGNTLVIVTHDLGILGSLSERLAVMYAGKIVEIAPTSNIMKNPLHPYSNALMESIPRIGDRRVRKGLVGNPPSLRNPPPGCRFHPRCPLAMEICRYESPPLVEVESNRWAACWLHIKR